MMKIYVQFDAAGKIQSLTALSAPDQFGLTLAPGPGTFVAEVEGIQLDENDVKDPEKLREIVARHKSVESFPRTRLS
jgi:hypothetical protein